MEPSQQVGRALLVLGAFIALCGAFLYFGAKLPFRLGRLPGDIVRRSGNTTFYFPIVTSLLLSAVLTAVLWLISRFRH